MSSLFRSLTQVGSYTALSRVLGLIRDLIIARTFGADAATDAFFVAFKIPNFLRRLFAEGAFSAAFVPVLAEYQNKNDPTRLRKFIAEIAGILIAILLLITILGVFSAPILVRMFAPGFFFNSSQSELTINLIKITFPYLLFISLTALAGGILNAYERFAIPAFAPVLLNLSLITCALWLAPSLSPPIVALAWGVLLAGLAQFVIQLPFLNQLKLLVLPRFKITDSGVWSVLRLMGPAILGVSVAQISLLIDTLLASFLNPGSLSWLYYSDRLMEFPLGILAVGLGTVILPRLSQQYTAQNAQAFAYTLQWALKWLFLLGFPAAIGLLILAGPVIATLFYGGNFAAHDVKMAAASLMAYAFGILGLMGIKVLAPGYYARRDVKTPVRIAVSALGIHIGLSLLLIFPLGHSGLALATTLSALWNTGWLLRGLLQLGILHFTDDCFILGIKAGFASLGMGIIIAVGRSPTLAWLPLAPSERVGYLLGWITLGIIIYLIILRLLGVRLRFLLQPEIIK